MGAVFGGTPPLLAAITFENFAGVLANAEFMGALLNSLIIGVSSTVLVLLIAVPAAFVCATFEFRGRANLESWILSTRMLPAFVVVLPYFIFFRNVQLLDTMLVLIIMFIVALPMRENKVPLDLPTNPTPPAVPPPVHRLDLDAAGQARLDGVAIADSALRARLAAIAADPAHPALHFSPDGATRYERVDQVLADIRGAGITSLGLGDAARFEADIAG